MKVIRVTYTNGQRRDFQGARYQTEGDGSLTIQDGAYQNVAKVAAGQWRDVEIVDQSTPDGEEATLAKG